MSAPLKTYKPGQSVTFSVVCTVNGVLTNPVTLTLSIRSADGTTASPTPVADSLGKFHVDYAFPMIAKAGVWCRRWQSVGSQPNENAIDEQRFIIAPLDYA